MSQDEERFQDYLQRVVRELEPPPEVPREAMWARIDELRRPLRARAAAAGRALPFVPRRWPGRVLRWAPALAAMLLLGIAIGRLTARRAPSASPVAAADPVVTADSAERLPYQLAATTHFARTEALLTSLPSEAGQGHGARVAGWAGDLLTDTRLLMDSPAGRDQELLRLLQDLEVVLAQIAALPGDVPRSEVQLIQDGIERRYVLLRLRAATARHAAAS